MGILGLAHLGEHSFAGRPVGPADQKVKIGRGGVLGPTDPLEIRDGGSRRDGGLGVEEAVAAVRERSARAPDVQDGHLAGAGPAEDISRGGDDCVTKPRHIEDVVDPGLADLFEGRQ